MEFEFTLYPSTFPQVNIVVQLWKLKFFLACLLWPLSIGKKLCHEVGVCVYSVWVSGWVGMCKCLCALVCVCVVVHSCPCLCRS